MTGEEGDMKRAFGEGHQPDELLGSVMGNEGKQPGRSGFKMAAVRFFPE